MIRVIINLLILFFTNKVKDATNAIKTLNIDINSDSNDILNDYLR